MKCVVAIVRPFLVDKILESLKFAPLEAMQIVEVKGYGRQKGNLDQYASNEFDAVFLPKVEITLWVDDLRLGEVVELLQQSAQTGRMGDGKLLVTDVENSINIT